MPFLEHLCQAGVQHSVEHGQGEPRKNGADPNGADAWRAVSRWLRRGVLAERHEHRGSQEVVDRVTEVAINEKLSILDHELGDASIATELPEQLPCPSVSMGGGALRHARESFL